ncbi:MAG: phospho-N-acetylmuramoyl-pentapeptide-transferase [Planctomycetes bacterium]|nr:phospho-N-acetylmuramoyl-pentapeptide-transferase [Planctomycetota bacterium]NOG55103.1 phospho-N-acetylmuramoyl-pentapeptide-transferase [Planctomycetota bacterium]
MITFIHDLLADMAADGGWYGYISIFQWVSFRAIAAVVCSFVLVIVLGKRIIDWLVRQKIGDAPEFYHSDLNQLMARKAATPTMGGIMISGAALVSTLLLADLANFYVLLGLIVLVWLSVLGGVDDWLKLTSARRAQGRREGLYAWEKMLFQLGIAFLAGVFIYRHGMDNAAMAHSFPTLPLMKAFDPATREPLELWLLPAWAFTFIAMIVISGMSNAVNLTDGMDGLASGLASISAFGLMVLCLIVGNDVFAKMLLMPWVPYTDELSVLAGALAGASLGFLWYNCSPAQVFMGDTGSLALGGVMAYIAVVIRQEFLFMLIGGVFVWEAFSVMLQVGYFKATKGKRIFRVAPIHHHYHLGGWTEQQVVVRFWVITAVLVAIALATIKLR